MSSAVVATTPPVSPVLRHARLRGYLDAYWLRPENALWMALRSDALAAAGWENPSLDVCCGDGVFSFLHHGGVFDPTFDVFLCVNRLDRVRDEHADVFDYCDEGYVPTILRPAGVTIDVGTDLKPALLNKARCVNLYKRLVEHDANAPLPLPDAAYRTVYCNAAYWVTHIDGFLRELARVVQPEGRVILQVKLDSMRQYTLDRHEAALGRRFLDLIGRGRLATWPTLTDRATWERRFAAAGLSIASSTPFVTRTHAHLWDVGLRPLAPLLIRMANALTPDTRAAIKRDWVDLLYELLEPLCDPQLDLLPGKAEPAEMQYILNRT
ncbi:MAG TPA: methyltransferase domain-containing protein [Phycisphaerae bacterium]|nr:methyltransferase domain-containing protein [Phycisphaerae bacterium]HNU45435.1 methyltransferase domain-containing protein [Phycisphaerae bacterium]